MMNIYCLVFRQCGFVPVRHSHIRALSPRSMCIGIHCNLDYVSKLTKTRLDFIVIVHRFVCRSMAALSLWHIQWILLRTHTSNFLLIYHFLQIIFGTELVLLNWHFSTVMTERLWDFWCAFTIEMNFAWLLQSTIRLRLLFSNKLGTAFNYYFRFYLALVGVRVRVNDLLLWLNEVEVREEWGTSTIPYQNVSGST